MSSSDQGAVQLCVCVRVCVFRRVCVCVHVSCQATQRHYCHMPVSIIVEFYHFLIFLVFFWIIIIICIECFLQ